MILPRRRFLITAASLLAAPAIVRASSLMPVSALAPEKYYGAIRDITLEQFAEMMRPQYAELVDQQLRQIMGRPSFRTRFSV